MEYPGPAANNNPIISSANKKLITTWSEANYSLFWFEDDSWTKTFVNFPGSISSDDEVELITVKKIDSDR